MDKTTTTTTGAAIVAATAGGAIWQEQEQCGAGEGSFGLNSRQQQQQLVIPCQERSIPDCVDSEKPIELVDHTWEPSMGQPMVQKVPATCALVACTKYVEVLHRLQHEKLHGKGTTTATFPYRAAPPSDLLAACRTDGVWNPGAGAYVGDVLNKIQEMGGVPATATTDAPTPTPAAPCVLLPLRSWEEHRWDDDVDLAAGRLSPGRVADLLYNSGPCIGVLWVSPWYHLYVGDGDDALVYSSGCGRSDDARRGEIEEQHPGQTAWHAVVCLGYRFRGGQMHVLVLDNQTPTGPRRWIHVEEFHLLYTLRVL